MNYDESAEVIVIDSNSIVYTRVLQFFFHIRGLYIFYTIRVIFVLK